MSDNENILEVSFEEIITMSKSGIPKRSERKQPVRRRKVAHSELITSSPYKKIIETSKATIKSKALKNTAQTKKKVNQIRQKTTSGTNRKVNEMKKKTADARKKVNEEEKKTKDKTKNTGNQTEKETTRKDKSKETSSGRKRRDWMRTGSTKRKRYESTQCGLCSVTFGCGSDPKTFEDWIQCKPCKTWFHESCAEESGILDDESFTCQNC
jgi:hypothetical protein